TRRSPRRSTSSRRRSSRRFAASFRWWAASTCHPWSPSWSSRCCSPSSIPATSPSSRVRRRARRTIVLPPAASVGNAGGSTRQWRPGAPALGVGIGGTFTDVALEAGGRFFSAKALTDYAAPERAILRAIDEVVRQAGIALAEVGTIIHGTTLATNALIQRDGARTAFVTTAGFRDVIEMRTESRFEQYDLDIVLPAPLIERCDRYTLAERIDASGRVLLAPDPAAIEAVVDAIAAGGYESVAVGFIHSYVD